MFKEQNIENPYFKFIIDVELFINFLSSLYSYKENIFTMYSNCICRILEDAILSDYELLLKNKEHTTESMYMLLKHFSLLEKDEAKEAYKEALGRIIEEPFVNLVMDEKTKDGYPVPALIKILLYEISKEEDIK